MTGLHGKLHFAGSIRKIQFQVSYINKVEKHSTQLGLSMCIISGLNIYVFWPCRGKKGARRNLCPHTSDAIPSTGWEMVQRLGEGLCSWLDTAANRGPCEGRRLYLHLTDTCALLVQWWWEVPLQEQPLIKRNKCEDNRRMADSS